MVGFQKGIDAELPVQVPFGIVGSEVGISGEIIIFDLRRQALQKRINVQCRIALCSWRWLHENQAMTFLTWQFC